MASPQIEDGYTQIANELYEAIIGFKCKLIHKDIIHTLIRFTYGFHRKEADLSLRYIADCTKVAYNKISPALNELIKMNVIKVVNTYTNKDARSIMLNKNYDEWISKPNNRVPKSGTPLEFPNQELHSSQIGDSRVPKSGTKKERLKERKKEILPSSETYQLSELLYSLILARDPVAKKPNMQKWAEHIEKLNRIDKRPFQEIREIIEWSQRDQFWKINIRSADSLREKYPRLRDQMNEEVKKKEMTTNKNSLIIKKVPA
jgi:phage replication O-like protein O